MGAADLLRRVLGDRRGSQLVEEGLLIGLSMMALVVIISMVSGLFSSLKGIYTSGHESLDKFIVDVLGKDLDKIWNSTVGWIFGG